MLTGIYLGRNEKIRVTVTRCQEHCNQIKGVDHLYAKIKKDA
jgi:hypothetical protein